MRGRGQDAEPVNIPDELGLWIEADRVGTAS